MLLYPHSALRTSSNVICQRETGEGSALLVIALSALMPLLLTLPARILLAMLALDLQLALFFARDVFLALKIGAPDHVFTHVYFARES